MAGSLNLEITKTEMNFAGYVFREETGVEFADIVRLIRFVFIFRGEYVTIQEKGKDGRYVYD